MKKLLTILSCILIISCQKENDNIVEKNISFPGFEVVGKWISDDSDSVGVNRSWWLQLDSTNGRGWTTIKQVSEYIYNTSPIAWQPVVFTPPCKWKIIGMAIEQGGNTAYPPTSQYWYFMVDTASPRILNTWEPRYVSDSIYHTRVIGSTYCN